MPPQRPGAVLDPLEEFERRLNSPSIATPTAPPPIRRITGARWEQPVVPVSTPQPQPPPLFSLDDLERRLNPAPPQAPTPAPVPVAPVTPAAPPPEPVFDPRATALEYSLAPTLGPIGSRLFKIPVVREFTVSAAQAFVGQPLEALMSTAAAVRIPGAEAARGAVSAVNQALQTPALSKSMFEDPQGTLGNPEWWAGVGGQAAGSIGSILLGAGLVTKGLESGRKIVTLTPKVWNLLDRYGVQASAALVESWLEGGMSYSEAKNAGASDGDAARAAAMTFAINLPLIYGTEIPLFNPATGRKALDAIIAALGESVQESGQQVAGNIGATLTYDPARPLTAGAAEAGIIGGLAGGPAHLALTAGQTPAPARAPSDALATFEAMLSRVGPNRLANQQAASGLAALEARLAEPTLDITGTEGPPPAAPLPPSVPPGPPGGPPAGGGGGVAADIKELIRLADQATDPESKAQFEQEARRLASVPPPSIPRGTPVEQAPDEFRATQMRADSDEALAVLAERGHPATKAAAQAELERRKRVDEGIATGKPWTPVEERIKRASNDELRDQVRFGDEPIRLEAQAELERRKKAKAPVTPQLPPPGGGTRYVLPTFVTGGQRPHTEGQLTPPAGAPPTLEALEQRLGETLEASLAGRVGAEGEPLSDLVADLRQQWQRLAAEGKTVTTSQTSEAFDAGLTEQEVARLWTEAEQAARATEPEGVESTQAPPVTTPEETPHEAPTLRREDQGPLAEPAAEDVPRPGSERGLGPARAARGRPPIRRPLERDTEQPGVEPSVGAGGPGVDVAGRGRGAGAEQPDTGEAPPASRAKREERAAPEPRGTNYRIQAADLADFGGPRQRYAANLKALQLLKQLEATGRPATAEEQQALIRYVGWGASELAAAFKNEQTSAELRDVLTEPEFEAARASTVAAHYTSKPVVDFMHQATQRMGFTGGRVLEPAMGIGHFFGLMPESIARKSQLSGVELDSVTARIAKQLYPQAHIQQKGLQEASLRSDYDLIIGNPPFGKFGVSDPDFKGRPPSLTSSIHNYFFAKAIDRVRPGGLVSFVTSHYTMDARSNVVRAQLFKDADFVGAVRLPRTAFKANAGTEVVTDILFFRKREPGEPKGDATWLDVDTVTFDQGQASVNRYFIEHPEMVLGTPGLSGTMYRGDEYTVEPSGDLAEQLAAALDRLPQGLYRPAAHPGTTATADEMASTADDELPGTYFIRDHQVFQKDTRGTVTAADLDATAIQRVKGQIHLRGAYQTAVRTMLDADASDADVTKARRHLSDLYDKFVKKFGPVSSTPNARAFRDDPTQPLVQSLESSYDKKANTATKADIFHKRTLQPPTRATSAESPRDALTIVLAESATVDWARMSHLTGVPVHQLQEELTGDAAFQTPTGDWETADAYLSGNVREKLTAAQAAKLDVNVKALEAVIPKDLSPIDIRARLGSPWIPASVYRQFFSETFDVSDYNVKLRFEPALGQYFLDAYGSSTASRVTYGTARKDAFEIAQAVLNNKTLVVYDSMPDGTRVVNAAASAEVRDKAAAISDAFEAWVWKDDTRADQLGRIYNDQFNNIAERAFDGSHLSFPGMTEKWRAQLRPHQRNAIWRGLVTPNLLMAHTVGSGKTATMIATAMEARRMGLSRKPVIVALNQTVEQIAAAAREMYPNINLLAPSKRDYEAANRKRTIARIASGDWDLVVIPHSQITKIGSSPQAYKDFLEAEIATILDAERAAKSERGDNAQRAVKDLEKRRLSLKATLDKKLDAAAKDRLGIYFEDLGIDRLTVDEAHEFKNLYFWTGIQRVRGVSSSASIRALDMFIKVQHIQRLNGGRGVTFATGTPISNTMGEAYLMMRYLQFQELRNYGVESFDAWAKSFAEIYDSAEWDVTGKVKVVRRMGRFINLPELNRLWRQTADVQTAEMLKLPVPKLKGGGPTVVAIEPTPALVRFVESLLKRAEALKGKRPEKGADNHLVITGDGRKAALDLRLVGIDTMGEGGKLTEAATRIAAIYKANDARHGTQLVFSDLGAPKTVAAGAEPVLAGSQFDVYAELKRLLVTRGVQADQVAFIHDAKTDEQKLKLYERMNTGDLRVLIASSKKGGVGVNVQQRLVALHHLDAPWRPADIEQREGRILRQGNVFYKEDPKGFEIEILRYVTKKSFDAVVWQILETKAAFIQQFLKGDMSVRDMEDVDQVVLGFAQMKAAAADDQRILRKAVLDAKVQRLGRQRRTYEQEGYEFKREGRLAEARLVNAQSDLAHLVAMQGVRVVPDEFQVVIGGRTVVSRKDVGEALLARIKKLDIDDGPQDFGTYAGLHVTASAPAEQVVARGGVTGRELFIDLAVEHNEFAVRIGQVAVSGAEDINPVGLATRIHNAATSRVDEEAEDARERVTRAQRDIATSQQARSEWPKEQEYQDAVTEQKALDTELGTDAKTQRQEQEVIVDEKDLATDDETEEDEAEPEPEVSGMRGRPSTPHSKPLPAGQPPLARGEKGSPSAIVRQIRALFNVPVMVGHFRQRATGIYKHELAAIRLKRAEDVLVVLHELGHHLSDQVRINLKDARWKKELLALGTLTTLPSDTRMQQRREGYAEFVRLYAMDPVDARAQAPAFAAEFEDQLKRAPDVASRFAQVTGLVRDYLAQAPAEQFRRKVDREGESIDRPKSIFAAAARGDIKEGLRVGAAKWVDKLVVLREAVDAMRAGRDLPAQWNAYILARLAAGATTKAEGFLTTGIRGADGQFLSGSLAAALDPVKHDLDAFGDYLVALRALELNAQGRESGFSDEQARAVIAETKARKDFDAFKQARQAVYAFQDAMLTYAHQAGVLSTRQLAAIREMNRWYVPFQRLRDEFGPGLGGRRGGGIANRRSPILRLRGSNRTVINPFESILKNTFDLVAMVEHNRAMDALGRQADATPGSAQWLERIPAPMVPKVVNALQAARKAGAPPPTDPVWSEFDKAGIDLDQLVTLFEQRRGPIADQNIILVKRDGKDVFYQVNRQDLYDVLTWTPEVGSELLGWLQAPTRLLRAAATMTPGFIARNPARDTLVAWFQSRHGFIPLVDTIRGLHGLMLNDADAKLFWTSGVAQAALVGGDIDRAGLRRGVKELTRSQFRRVVRHPIDYLRAVSRTFEAATRLGEFKLALEAGGQTRGVLGRLWQGSQRTVTAETLTVAELAARDVSLDFGRAGTVGEQVNRYYAFSNAQIQGLARMGATLKRDPLGVTLKLGMLGLFTYMLWWLNYDDDEYQNIPDWEKNAYWHVPALGGFLKIPKPFEWGAVTNLVEAALTYAWEKHQGNAYAGEAFDRFKPETSVAKMVVSQLAPTGILPLLEVGWNYDTFRNTYIEKPWAEGVDKRLQVSDWTTDTARVLSRILPLSPVQVDHLIYGYTAGFGRGIVKAVDPIAQLVTGRDVPPKPSLPWRSVPVVGTFFREGASHESGAGSIDRYYKALDTMRDYAKSYEGLVDAGDRPAAEATREAARGRRWFERHAALKASEKTMKALGKEADAVYAAPVDQMTPAEKRARLDGIYERMVATAGRALGRRPGPPVTGGR